MSENRSDRIAQAADIIRRGGLVAVPTETVYGLAADATRDAAVAGIFEAKTRPQFNPLIIHVTGAEMAGRYVEFSPFAEQLAAHFWPGPLTIILPRRAASAVSLLVSAGLETIAVRAPDHPIAQALIKNVDRPLAAPSANRSGSISPTKADHVRQSLGDRIDLIIDGGPCPVGIESTIIKVAGDGVTMLRPGGIAREAIEEYLERSVSDAPQAKNPEAPGMLASHYAPRAMLRLNANAPQHGEAFLGFGEIAAKGADALNLSKSGDLLEATANLFAHLHALDRNAAAHGLKTIAVAPIPMEGLGEAINDRLNRAAAPRGGAL